MIWANFESSVEFNTGEVGHFLHDFLEQRAIIGETRTSLLSETRVHRLLHRTRPKRGSRILTRGAPSPKFAQNRGFSLENYDLPQKKGANEAKGIGILGSLWDSASAILLAIRLNFIA